MKTRNRITERASLLGFMLLLALPGIALAQSSAAPSLTALSFAPTAINTSASPASVTVNFTSTDTFAGISYFETAFIDPSGVVYLRASKTLSPPRSPATDSVVVTLPQFSSPGTWTLAYVFIADTAGGTLYLDNNGIATAGFPTALQVTSAQDTVPPNITAFSFSPASINTTSASATVTVNFTLTDDLSGASNFQAVFTSPSGSQTQTATASFPAATTVTNSATAIFPRFIEAGTWTVTNVIITDAVGNTLVLGPTDLSSRGFASTLTVASGNDTTLPTLTAFTFTPTSINVTSAPATVTASFQATDDFSGVTSIQASFLSPSGSIAQVAAASFAANTSVAGSAPVTFSRTSENGTWTVNTIILSDAAGNTKILATSDLVALGFPTQLAVTNTNTNPTPPVITGTVNPAPGSSGWNTTVPVTVSWTITDPSGSGIVSTTGCGNSTLSANTSGTTLQCSATNNQGATGSGAVTVRIDTLPPAIAPVITPAPNAAGWNNSNVTLNWTVTDPISGINSDATTGCDPVALATETAGTTFTCMAVNGAGLSSSMSVTIRIDKTLPTATAAASPAPNAAGWNSTNVTVTFTGADSLSGIASCTAPITLSTEGTGQTASGTCTDRAGNVSAPATASGINIDKTPPVIVPTVSPAPNAAGWNNTSPVTVSWSVTEPSPGSSITSSSGCTTSIVTAETAGTTFTCTATNIAGLTTTVSVTVKLDKTAPVTSNVHVSPSQIFINTGTSVTATVTDSGGSNLASAEYNIDGGNFNAMSGTFGGSTANVTATTPVFTATGVHNICVRGDDIAGNIGTPVCTTVAVFTAAAPSSGTTCNGAYNGTFNGSITVSNGQVCDLEGTVTGSVTQTGGTLILLNASIGGSVQVVGGIGFSIKSTTINGALQVASLPTSSAVDQICGSHIKSSLQVSSSGTAVHIGEAASCAGNTIDGSLQVQSNSAQTLLIGNHVGGSLQDNSNVTSTSPATQVTNNIITGVLQCSSNSSIVGSGNTASVKQGQCSTF